MSRSQKSYSTSEPGNVVHEIAKPRTPSSRRSTPTLSPEETPTERAERIRQLREQVENGTYMPDPREIARHILENGL